jgi:AcrR family transcriptional regulator
MSATRTKEDVVRAAGRLFAERGFHGTSMRDLGEELGLLGSSLYSHIEGKEQLLVEVIGRGGEMFQALADEVAAAEGTPTERMRRLIEGHVGVIVDNAGESATFLYEARFLPPDRWREVVAMRDRYEAVFRRVLEEGAATGEFSGVADPALASIFVLSILNALGRWYRPGGRLEADEIAAAIGDFVLGGIA